MYKMMNCLKENGFYISVLSIAVILMSVYISESSSNVPIMDYWTYLNALADKTFNGGVAFHDLYSNNGVHRTPLQLLLFVINLKLFSWDTQVSMYLGVFITSISIFVVYRYLCKFITNEHFKRIAFVLIVLCMYSLGPYEIITQEFYTSFAIRILSFLVGIVMIDSYIRDENKLLDGTLFLLITYNAIVFLFIGGMYSFAYISAICGVYLLHLLLEYKDLKLSKEKLVNFLFFVVIMAIVAYVYLNGIDFSTVEKSGIELNVVKIIKTFLLLTGGSLFGSYINVTYAYIFGTIIIILNIYFIVIYIYRQKYKDTYFPLYLYIYYLLFYLMLYVGRSGYGEYYFLSPRYIFDSSLMILSLVFITFINLQQIYCSFNKIKLAKIKAVICLISLFFVLFGIIYCDNQEKQISVHRKVYCNNLINKMYNLHDVSDEQLSDFQSNPNLVRNGVVLMKKYKLGVFKYD